jgi:hypothetical protein
MASYLAGRVSAEQVVAAVADAYYRGRPAEREQLQPVLEVIERVAPGVAGLARTKGGTGFDIRLVERPFPKEDEPQLRRAVEEVLPGFVGGVRGTFGEPGGLLSRMLRAVRRLFSAST